MKDGSSTRLTQSRRIQQKLLHAPEAPMIQSCKENSQIGKKMKRTAEQKRNWKTYRKRSDSKRELVGTDQVTNETSHHPCSISLCLRVLRNLIAISILHQSENHAEEPDARGIERHRGAVILGESVVRPQGALRTNKVTENK